MLNARRQAEGYARALPVSHGWPPFILVCDVGHVLEVYADFSGQGKNYAQFPDRQSFRIYLEDLRQAEVCDRLVRIWTDPLSLDPARKTARVTRAIAERVGAVSRALEGRHHPEEVALSDALPVHHVCRGRGLLPDRPSSGLLERMRAAPGRLRADVERAWEVDGHAAACHRRSRAVKRFNGSGCSRTPKVHPPGPRGDRRAARRRGAKLEREWNRRFSGPC